MAEWTIIGVPTSAGAHHAGLERAPAALREAGLADRLTEVGAKVTDAGDLPGATFAVDRDHPGARNAGAVIRVAREVADAVAGVLVAGGRPLVLGGDCTITLGVIAGFRQLYPDVGLAYVDGDADLGADDSPGILDSLVVAHLLGYGVPELAGLAGPPPLLKPARLAMIGADLRGLTSDQRQRLADAKVSLADSGELSADPEGTARRGLAALAGPGGPIAPLVVHFDADVVDSGDLPLGNFPHYGSGVLLAHAVRCLRLLLADPACACLVLTEVNPTYDPDGSLLDRYCAGVAAAMTE